MAKVINRDADIAGVVDPDKLKKEYGSATVFRTMCLVANWVVRDENCQVNGIKVLIDWSGITLQHASIMFTEGNAKRFMNFYQVKMYFLLPANVDMTTTFIRQKINTPNR